MSSVTAKELAEMLGLSQAAVSLALRGKPGVSEKTRRRVLEKAAEMGLVRETLPQLQKQSPGKRIRFLIFVNHLVSIAENTTFSSFLLKGAECDYDRCCDVVLDEFRAGKLGRITLEWPGEAAHGED